MTTSDQRYTIGELARLCGLPVRRIRFYSDKGLLPPATRTMANYRVYSDADAARLDLIQALRAMGVGLAAIRGILVRRVRLPGSCSCACPRSKPRSPASAGSPPPCALPCAIPNPPQTTSGDYGP